MRILDKLFGKKGKKKENKNNLHPLVSKTIPGPIELRKRELESGDEERYCQYLKRNVVLIKDAIEKGLITCEWTLKDHGNKQLCYNSCIHNMVNQLVIIAYYKEHSIPLEDVYSGIPKILIPKDYAPKSRKKETR